MIIARITFSVRRQKAPDWDALTDAAEWYLASLHKNGQIYGHPLLAWSNGTLVAYAQVARPDALAERHHSEWAMRDRQAVTRAFGESPKSEVIANDIAERFRSWKRSTHLYLFTHAFDDTSPVCCGDTGAPIPLYLLPIDQMTRQGLSFWASSYKHHDNIWFGSSTLEIPAYKELADPASALSSKGRELCATVEQCSGKPTYYFLHRYWGRKSGEAERLCPSCGQSWHVAERRPDLPAFHHFEFRCKKCRLVSHCAVDAEDERHARIGEFKRDK